MKKGDKYKCIKNGAYYEIIAKGLMKNGEVWTKSVTYQSVNDGAFYTRSLLEFNGRFYKS